MVDLTNADLDERQRETRALTVKQFLSLPAPRRRALLEEPLLLKDVKSPQAPLPA